MWIDIILSNRVLTERAISRTVLVLSGKRICYMYSVVAADPYVCFYGF